MSENGNVQLNITMGNYKIPATRFKISHPVISTRGLFALRATVLQPPETKVAGPKYFVKRPLSGSVTKVKRRPAAAFTTDTPFWTLDYDK